MTDFQGIYEPGSVVVLAFATTGVAPSAIQVSKNGGPFAMPGGVFTSLGGDFYTFTLPGSFTDTEGPLLVNITAGGELALLVQIRALKREITAISNSAVQTKTSAPTSTMVDDLKSTMTKLVRDVNNELLNLRQQKVLR